MSFVSSGRFVTLTAPAGGVVAGTAYQIGQFFVVAEVAAAQGVAFRGALRGVYSLPKATGATWSEGQVLYWDDTAKKVTTLVGSGNLPVGAAAAAALTGDTTGQIRVNAIARPALESDLASGAVQTAEIADLAVTKAKALVFASGEVTATGSEQSVAHGLAAVPSIVIIAAQSHPGTPDTGAFDIAEGTHTTTNVVFTATVNLTVKVFAWS